MFREGGQPEEADALAAESASAEGFRGVEVGKILLGENGTLRARVTAGRNPELADAVALWVKSLLGHAAPRPVVVEIVGGLHRVSYRDAALALDRSVSMGYFIEVQP